MTQNELPPSAPGPGAQDLFEEIGLINVELLSELRHLAKATPNPLLFLGWNYPDPTGLTQIERRTFVKSTSAYIDAISFCLKTFAMGVNGKVFTPEEQNLHEIFEYARRTPVLLLLDEFDAISKERDDAHEIGEMKRAVNSLLMELDRLPTHGLIVAATNHPHLVDSAIKRRFELHLDLILPDSDRVVAILESHLGRQSSPLVRQVARMVLTEASGAEIAGIAVAALRRRALAEASDTDAFVIAEFAKRACTTQARRTMARALASTHSMAEIGDILRVSKSTVHEYLKKGDANDGEVHAARQRGGVSDDD